MKLYPAIDIKDGKCVRLHRGAFSEMTVYSDRPWEVAAQFEALGAGFIHTVDLDGARSGQGKNRAVIKKICQAASVPVQLGGGVRDMAGIAEALDCGVSRVILGTAAVENPTFVKEALGAYGDKIAIGIDAKDGYVAIKGWETVSGQKAVSFARTMVSLGAKTIIYTDIATDGTLAGPNLAAMAEMAQSAGCDVIASGGVGKLEDVAALSQTGVAGVIIGKAIYEKTLDLKKALELYNN